MRVVKPRFGLLETIKYLERFSERFVQKADRWLKAIGDQRNASC